MDPGTQAHVIKIKFVPSSTTIEDVKVLLNDCNIVEGPDGVYFWDRKVFYVVMKSLADVERANLKIRTTKLGGRFVQVFPSDMDEMRIAQSGNINVVRIRGIPSTGKRDDIIDFFQGLDVININMFTNASGRPIGTAFVQFSDHENVENALKRHKQCMGHRYIEVYENVSDKSKDFKDIDDPSLVGLHVVKLEGIPYRAKREDVFKWVNQMAEPAHVSMIIEDGQFNGNALAFLKSDDEVDAVMTLDRSYLGDRYIVLTYEGKHGDTGGTISPGRGETRYPTDSQNKGDMLRFTSLSKMMAANWQRSLINSSALRLATDMTRPRHWTLLTAPRDNSKQVTQMGRKLSGMLVRTRLRIMTPVAFCTLFSRQLFM